MSDRREKYHAVNGQWPDVLPELTGPEAIGAAKRLYRFAMKRPFRGRWKLTSGNRFSYIRGNTFYVNPKRTGWGFESGWHDLVHMLSHACHQRLYPKHNPHDGRHHFLEKEMVAYVIRSGWLEGKLKPKPRAVRPKPSPADKVQAGIKRWTTKLRRAETALRKLRRKAAAAERRAYTHSAT